VCGGEGIDRLSEPTRLAPVQTVVRWSASEASGDVRPPDSSPGTAWDPVRVPAWRWSARIALEGAADATGSQYGYGRALLETSGARVFGRVAELVARVRAGAISGDDVLPPQVRLYSGGVSTVRGAEQNLLGPKVLVTSSDGALPAVCDAAASCDLAPIDPARISVRPTGGDRVLEANIEARWWLASVLQLAAFLDYGRLERTGGGEFGNGAAGELHEALFAPGVGVRLITDLGPIRVDIGYDASGPKTLPLLTDDGTGGVRSAGYVRFDPFEWDDPGALRAFVRRLQLHMAIGQAF
jgi:outer membrane protein insertion porin family/translocation and assembly module TamA